MKIKRKLIAVLGIISFLTSLSSLAYSQAKPSPKPSPAPNKSFLWKVKSDKNTVYLLGSIHLLKKENYPLNEAIEKAFTDSKILVLETDIDSAAQPDAQKLFISKAMYAEGKTLENTLSKENLELVKKTANDLGLPFEGLNRFEPWFVGVTLTMMKYVKMGNEPKYGIDMYFLNKAKQDKKQVLFLETVEYQLDRLDQMSIKDQELWLIHSIKQMDKVESQFADAVNAWAKGDDKALDASMNESMKEFPVLNERLLVERNKNWIPHIETYLKSNQNHIVVVGAAHMVGEAGVINLLRKKGYTVEQL
jgi:uncharacterized protein